MRIARALAIKAALPSRVAAVLLSGAAVAVPSIVASVNSVLSRLQWPTVRIWL